ncbi:MAG TPA: POTRA domain-containing protein [Terriglobia bacterium]|nr:POTRA domain-containing protein [Terriglobia bacterium]
MKIMNRLLLVLMLAGGCGFAQKAPVKGAASTPLARWPIESLVVEGNHTYSAGEILAAAGLKVGEVVGKPEFEAARMRLLDTGAFETVGYKFTPGSAKGYAAVFQVTEVQQAYPAEFEELHVSEQELRAGLRARDPLFASGKIPATQPAFARYQKWVQELVAAKGVTDKIVVGVAPSATGEFAVVFRPAHSLPAVALVTFRGNHVVPSNLLHDAIAGAGIGSEYTEDRFREILNSSIRPLYEARGRMRVKFTEISTEPDKDVQGVHVFVTIDEGRSYTLGKVSIEGPTPVEAGTLLRTMDVKAGDVANFDKINQGLDAMRKELRRTGYLNAKLSADRVVDDGHETVDAVIRVDPGPQYIMGKLGVSGLDLEGEAEILRLWTMKTGKPFNPEYPEYFFGVIRQENLFEHLGKTAADVKLNDKTHTADVRLVFSAEKPAPKTAGPGPGPGGE